MLAVIFFNIFLTFLTDAVESCSCFPSHPQQLFCNSQIAIHAIVTSDQFTVETASDVSQMHDPSKIYFQPKIAAYNISLLHVFRGMDVLFGVLKNQEQDMEIQTDLKYSSFVIYTPNEQDMCGISLTFSKTYLLFGQIRNNRIEINLCNFISDWDEVTNQVKRGIHGDYDCRCQVETRMALFNDDADTVRKENSKPTCYLNIHANEPVDECALNFLTCRKLVNPMIVNEHSEDCVWIEGEEYQQCIKS